MVHKLNNFIPKGPIGAISPYPTVVIVTTAHQNESGIDLNCELSFPASAKYTADEKRTTPKNVHAFM